LTRRTLRVIAGTAGGLRLAAPRGDVTRPTSDRVRESVFGALGDVTDAVVLDLYAGSGALAIEALSRGAGRAVLVDRDRRAVEACAANLLHTRLRERARVQARSVPAFLSGAPVHEAPFDLVFLDPPYALTSNELSEVLGLLAEPRWLAPAARVVVERPAGAGRPELPEFWAVGWERAYGDTLVFVVTVAPSPGG
jgi:16S rRNA (guanine966-N2)-methyltransferase